MKLKTTEYKTIEVAEDESYGMVIGNIVLDKNKMLYAEIVGETICDREELANVRAFLDEVEDAMETGTLPTILNWSHDIEMLPDSLWSVIQQKDVAIEELKDQNVRDLRELYDIYEAEIFAIKAVRKTAMILSKEIINDLESKLAARKKDSDVLMKVVEIVKKWEDDMHWDRTVMKQIVIVVKDYVDASEEPPEHHAIWEQEIVIPGNTSYTVEINSRCE